MLNIDGLIEVKLTNIDRDNIKVGEPDYGRTLREARLIIENNISEHNMTLAEAIEDYLCRCDIPLEQVRTRVDNALVDKLKAELNPLRKNYKRKKTLFNLSK